MQMKICNNYAKLDTSILDYEDLRIPINENNWRNIKKRSSNVALAITNRCNMFCKVCYAQNEEGGFSFDEMSLETIRQILSRIGKNKKILLLGGEPTLRDDLFDIIKVIKLSGNVPILYTNGIKLADENYVDKLIKAGVKKIFLSIDSLNENIATRLRGDSTCHYSKLEALNNLKRSGKIKVWLSVTVARNINEEEVKSLLDFALEHNNFIKGFIFTPCMSVGWYQLPTSAQLNSADLISILNKLTNGVLEHRYFYEFNLLRYNLNLVLNKIGNNFPLYRNSVYLNVEQKSFKELISVEDLKKINYCFEKKQYFGLLKYVFRYNLWLFVWQAIINPGSIEDISYRRPGLHIMIDEVKLPAVDLNSLAMTSITLAAWQSNIFAVYTI
ncbi:MAG: radical SAM protein [Candidatus Kaelpia aquatica]|nr:radical SAM protein [Candidatus Kaelpia aquatica]